MPRDNLSGIRYFPHGPSLPQSGGNNISHWGKVPRSRTEFPLDRAGLPQSITKTVLIFSEDISGILD